MDQPVYLRRLIEQKYILIVGIVVAIIAGLFAGFAYVEGEFVSRTTKTYTASSTVLLTSPVPELYQVQIPAVTQAVPVDEEGNPTEQELIVTQATPIDLSSSAIILAYMASSDEIADAVEAEIGLEEGEAITAVRRTTQPTGDERFGGRLELPIIDIAGIATSAERAVLIAASATTAFDALVLEQQEEWGVAEEIRLTLDELNAPVADEGEGSNPAIPIIVVGFGVFLLFIALALIVGSIRDRRRAKRAAAADTAETETDTAETETVTTDADAVTTDADAVTTDADADTTTAAEADEPLAVFETETEVPARRRAKSPDGAGTSADSSSATSA